MKQWFVVLIPVLAWVSAPASAQPATPEASPVVARIGDTAFIQLTAESFKQLDPRNQALAYWLTRASIAIDPIVYDQLSAYGLREKRIIEGVMSRPAAVDPAVFEKVRRYALLFWANRGNHHEMTVRKFVPDFSPAELEQAALKAQAAGAFRSSYGDLPGIEGANALKRELDALKAPIFDPEFEPMMTVKTPPPGKDILQASSNTFYPGLTLADLKGFSEEHALNSRVVKGPDGVVRELVYRAGTDDGAIRPGLYAVYLKKAIGYLRRARAVADPEQAAVIDALIRFYQTGNFRDWVDFGMKWVRNDATVDFANGFIEVYRDARGAKGSSQSFVTVTDRPVSTTMGKLARNAEYFEQKAPWDAKYKKSAFNPPVVKAVEVLIETGDFHVTTIGDNLPNENEVRQTAGSKNFLFLGSSHALSRAASGKVLPEFTSSPEERVRAEQYAEDAEDMMTALHEVIGHGSGRLSEKVGNSPAKFLKEYYSTLEEARADLMALWSVWDPKLKELGLVENQDELAKAMYDSTARVPLTQLRRILKGDTIEEDHQRGRQLIAFYVMDKTGGIERVERNDRTFYRVTDYAKMREGVGMLLAELMRIKAEGDYDAIKALVDKYGVHIDPVLRDQVVARYRALDLPTYWAGVNPVLEATVDARGQATNVTISYPRDAVAQYLAYGRMYDSSLGGGSRVGGARRSK